LVLSAAPTITGHPTVEGVTSTGATGTGNLVYSASPTLSGTLAMGAGNITMTGSLGATGVGKLTKIWSVDGEFTNLPTINGGTLKAGLGVTTVGNSYMTLVNPSAITFPRMNADNTVTAQTAANYRTDLGATTVGANLFTLANPSAITFPRFNADNTVTALSAANFKTALSLTSTDVGLNNLTNKLQVELEDSVNYANGYMSRYDGVTGLALKLNLADSVNYTNGYTSKYDSRFLDATSSIQTQLDSKTDTTELNEIVYIEDATISGGVVKITIGWDGAAGCDFVWTGTAGHAAQNLDIGSIIPAKADVIKVDVVNTEALVGCTDMNIGVGNASGGAQYLAAASLDELNEVITSTAVLTDAVLMNWAAASNVWISGDPSDNNWSDMTAGKWTVYVTYVYYGNL
jgi:hypothetical protein